MDEAEVASAPRTGVAVLGTAALLEACGGSDTPSPMAAGLPDAKLTASFEAARFLQHAQFSSSEAEIAAVRSQGASAWLDGQMALNSSLGAWDWLKQRGYGVIDQNRFYEMEFQSNYMAWYQIMASPDGVRRRIALALSEFFVVGGAGVGTLTWGQFAMGAYWDVLCKNAFGNFRVLLEEITLNIAMGEFLNTLGNQKEDATTGRLPDENYSREVMQLFTIGLLQLNVDGTPKLGANGQALETFTQSDVSNLARVFTGYESDTSEGYSQSAIAPTYTIRNVGYTRRPMVLNAKRHSSLRAEFLGAVVEAGTDGKTALKIALDTLFQHPNVGPFFARQMIQRLVCSDPAPNYVARVATVFNNNGKGERGDLAAVFKAILLDTEATSAAGLTSTTFGQWANKNLDSSEKLVLGGNTGIRAYGSSEAGGANGQILNMEARWRYSPALALSAFYDVGCIQINVNNDYSGAPAVNDYCLKGSGLAAGWTSDKGASFKVIWSRRIGVNPNANIETGQDQDGSLVLDRFWLTAAMVF
jgi:uncharacterized protein (DUF1800 family)